MAINHAIKKKKKSVSSNRKKYVKVLYSFDLIIKKGSCL